MISEKRYLTFAQAEKNIITDKGTKIKIVPKSGCKAISNATNHIIIRNGTKLF
jgi:hypothetical protein